MERRMKFFLLIFLAVFLVDFSGCDPPPQEEARLK
jgi:hypothetical protein